SATSSSTGVETDPGMAGLPGVTSTSAWRDSTSARPCSRPPEPTTTTFIATTPSACAVRPTCTLRPRSAEPTRPRSTSGVTSVDVLLPTRPHADQRHRHPDLLLQERQVGLGLRWELAG